MHDQSIMTFALCFAVVGLALAHILSVRSSARLRATLKRTTSQLDKSTEALGEANQALANLSEAHERYKTAMEKSEDAHVEYENALLARISFLERVTQ
jgi:hypothetical protein